jgi:type II pantothenate kinase
MVFQTIGMLAVFALRESTTKDIVLTGTLTVMPEIREVFSALEALHPVNFILPENSVFATAIGAALLYLDKNC